MTEPTTLPKEMSPQHFQTAGNRMGTISIDGNRYRIYSNRVARPPKPAHLRRSKMLPIRLTADEYESLARGSQQLGVSVSDVLRHGAALYIEMKSKDGSPKRKEKQR